MARLTALALILLAGGGLGKQFKAKWTDCGSKMELEPAPTSNVTISAPYNKAKGRHSLFKGRTVKICIKGTFKGINLPVEGVKNSAHGQIVVPLLNTLPVAVDFCDIQLDGCVGADPPCKDLSDGGVAEFCSTINVPDIPSEPDVDVTWKILAKDRPEPGKCEKEFDLGRLKNKGKLPIACIRIDARVAAPFKRKKQG